MAETAFAKVDHAKIFESWLSEKPVHVVQHEINKI
jgi:hypothetical protein